MTPQDSRTHSGERSHWITWAWLMAAAGGLIVTLACASAQVFVTEWRGVAASRIAMAHGLKVRLALGALGALLLVGAAGYAIRRGASLADFASRCRPLAWLLVLAVPFLPGLADVFPALAALAGPTRWFIAVTAVLACVAGGAPGALRRWWSHVNPRPVTVLAIAFVVYAVAGLWVTRVHGVAGDEPHYLIITESLLRDGDLQIENNHERGDYRRFFQGPPLPPHYVKRGVGDVIYSIHAPGLPALVLPAYAIAGRIGVNVFLGAVAALAALAVFLLARALVGPGLAVAVWIGVAFTTPFLMHGWLIYPEMPATCIVAWALWWAWQEPAARVRTWLWRGAVVAFLPWLHAKFVVLLAGLALVIALRLLRRPGMLVAFAGPIAASVAAWFYSFYVMYGVADPTIPYGGTAAQGYQWQWANIPRGLLGLLFDQEFGLLLYSPIYLVALAGFATLVRRRDARPVVAAACLAGGAFLLSSTRYYMWWGGWSVPGRFTLPVLVMAAPFLAEGVRRLSAGPRGRVFMGVTLGASLVTSALLVARPGVPWMFNDRDATGNLLEWLQGSGPLTSMWPSLLAEDWRAQLSRVAMVVGGLLVGLLALWIGGRRARPDENAERVLVMPFIVATLVGVALLGSLAASRAVRTDVMRRGQLQLMNAWDGRDVFDVSRVRRITPSVLLRRMRVPLFTAPGELPDEDRPLEWLGPWELPAGKFALQVWRQPRRKADGELVAWFHRTSAVAARAATDAGIAIELPVFVPVGIVAPPLWLGASNRAVAEQVTRVELVPLEILPPGPERHERPRALETIEGPPGAYLAYLDRNAFPEGGVFWTKGQSETELLVITGGASRLHIEASVGAAAGTATIAVDGVPTAVPLTAGEARSLDIALGAGRRTARLKVAFPAGFRPSEVEKGSSDTRWLGVRVRVWGE